jgi:hypothetical protein
VGPIAGLNGRKISPPPGIRSPDRPARSYTAHSVMYLFILCICVGPRASLDRCGKSRHHLDSIPGPSSAVPVTIPTELPGPQTLDSIGVKLCVGCTERTVVVSFIILLSVCTV